MNYLCIFPDQNAPAAYVHNGVEEAKRKIEKPFFVMYRDPASGI